MTAHAPAPAARPAATRPLLTHAAADAEDVHVRARTHRRLPRTVRRARTTRRLGRAPGRLAVAALLVLAAVGVKATFAPRPVPVSAPAVPAADARDITAQGFAQAFARAYLSWDARQPEQHQRQVTPFLSEALDGDGGLQIPPHGRQQVVWSAAIQDQADARGEHVITVAVQTTRQLLYLAVPVQRTDRGFLVVPHTRRWWDRR